MFVSSLRSILINQCDRYSLEKPLGQITQMSSCQFLSSPFGGKREVIVTILVRCMCVRPSEFVRTITCTMMRGFQNSLEQLLPLRRKSAV